MIDEDDQRANVRAMHDKIRMINETKPLVQLFPEVQPSEIKSTENWFKRFIKNIYNKFRRSLK